MKEKMYFCDRCSNFSPSNLCDYCGKKRLREAKENDPVYLVTKSTVYAGMLEEALKRNNIPHIKREKHGGMLKYMGLGLGLEDFDFFVPFAAKQQCDELLKELFNSSNLHLTTRAASFKKTSRPK